MTLFSAANVQENSPDLLQNTTFTLVAGYPKLEILPFAVLLQHTISTRRMNDANGYSNTRPCLSVRIEQLGSHGTDFHEIYCLRISRKFVKKFKFH